MCHTARLQIWLDGGKSVEKAFSFPEDGQGNHIEYIVDRVLTGHLLRGREGSLATCSQMARTDLYRDLKFDDALRRSEDTDFCIRAALKGIYFASVDDAVVCQTVTGGKDKTVSIERDNILRVMEKHKVLIERYQPYGFASAWVKIKYDRQEKGFLSCLGRSLNLFFHYPVQTGKKGIRFVLKRLFSGFC